MKNTAAGLLKHMISKLTMALKRKTRAFKTRLVILSLLHSSSFSHKLKGLMNHQLKSQGEEETDQGKTVVVYKTAVSPVYTKCEMEEEEDEECRASVTEMPKVHPNEDRGEEIDQLADLFIRRFHRQMWLQKQLSLESRHHDPDDHAPPLH
ncbi:PREDICTED: uncharacterized protein LOC104823341 [Tarenaya hassleriana]|uniref:uncharacterized protein LOC104823341 n=1 Tax=Tarenaya hassleriana TaxID=28532 RepID=UPI00053C56F4|nr:PREDICTED: uncharacterized protein LOC104823341 [Tarenaya hassleriana]